MTKWVMGQVTGWVQRDPHPTKSAKPSSIIHIFRIFTRFFESGEMDIQRVRVKLSPLGTRLGDPLSDSIYSHAWRF